MAQQMACHCSCRTRFATIPEEEGNDDQQMPERLRKVYEAADDTQWQLQPDEVER